MIGPAGFMAAPKRPADYHDPCVRHCYCGAQCIGEAGHAGRHDCDPRWLGGNKPPAAPKRKPTTR